VKALDDLFHVSAAPHDRSTVTTKTIMQAVIIALLPAGLFGVYNFGIRALMVIVTTVLACVLTELVYCKLMKKPSTISDFSAVVTGILLAYNLPAGIPLYMAVLGGIFAILIVQMLLEAYVPVVNQLLGIYIPLIVVNCIILGRAEAYAAKNKVVVSFFDGIGMGLGFTIALTLIGSFRELLGAGTIFGFRITPD